MTEGTRTIVVSMGSSRVSVPEYLHDHQDVRNRISEVKLMYCVPRLHLYSTNRSSRGSFVRGSRAASDCPRERGGPRKMRRHARRSRGYRTSRYIGTSLALCRCRTGTWRRDGRRQRRSRESGHGGLIELVIVCRDELARIRRIHCRRHHGGQPVSSYSHVPRGPGRDKCPISSLAQEMPVLRGCCTALIFLQ
jgi:hypothetical protein